MTMMISTGAAAAGVSLADRDRITRQVESEIHAMTVRECACGCGESTARTFRPGHDARLRKRLIEERLVAAAAARVAKAEPPAGA